jgi:formylglycine-generating enzyme required for sulfatase activity
MHELLLLLTPTPDVPPESAWPLDPAGPPIAPPSPPPLDALALPPVVDPSTLTCPGDAQLVVGLHWENVQRWCTRFAQRQCWAFLPGAIALEARATPIATCVDRYEWPNRKGAVPPVMMTFVEAQASCASVGKRLCTEFEWEQACEGPAHWPFPYGHAHEPDACNNDKPYRPYSPSALGSLVKEVREAEAKRLYQGEPSGARPRCKSPYGVYDLVGNVEEWVTTSRPEWPHPSSLKGAYWAKPWSGCRGTNDSHGPLFRFYDVGFRCCSEPSPRPPGDVPRGI